MKKILFVVHGLQAAGIETFLINVLKNIDKTSMHFDFAINAKESEHQFYENVALEYGAKVFKLGDTKSKLRTLSKIEKRKNLKKLLMKEHYDIVHINSGTNICFFDALICKESKINRIIIHAHNSEMTRNIHLYYMQKLVHYIVKPFWNKVATDFFACSDVAARWMFPKNVLKSVVIVNNGIDINFFCFSPLKRDLIRDGYKINSKDILIGTIGRIEYQKNQQFLIDMLEHLLKLNSCYKLMIIGDGSLKKDLINISIKKNIQNSVLFVGTTNDIPSFLSAMDIFVMPSRFEGFGIAAIEAQSNGLPCLVSNFLPDSIIINCTCCKLPIDDVNIWASKIIKLDRVRIVPDKGINKFSINSVCHQLENIYLNENWKVKQ